LARFALCRLRFGRFALRRLRFERFALRFERFALGGGQPAAAVPNHDGVGEERGGALFISLGEASTPCGWGEQPPIAELDRVRALRKRRGSF